MLISAASALAVMAVSLVFLEWLDHAVVHPAGFLFRPEYGQALIPGVPNIRLAYVLAGFAAFGVLWALPFPHSANRNTPAAPARERAGLRRAVLVVTAGVVLALLVSPGGHPQNSLQVGVEHIPGQLPTLHAGQHGGP